MPWTTVAMLPPCCSRLCQGVARMLMLVGSAYIYLQDLLPMSVPFVADSTATWYQAENAAVRTAHEAWHPVQSVCSRQPPF